MFILTKTVFCVVVAEEAALAYPTKIHSDDSEYIVLKYSPLLNRESGLPGYVMIVASTSANVSVVLSLKNDGNPAQMLYEVCVS